MPTAFLILLLAVNLTFFSVNAASAAGDARGLKAVAIDKTTQQPSEVKLYDKSYAVIIGIDQYKHLPPDRQLKFAVRDAKGIEATLKRHYKFDQVVSLFNQDATRARILDVLTDELPAKMGENDALFVFFAGHGDQIKSRGGDIGYLIPHDGQVGRLSSVISMADLRDTVSKAIPAKHVFYVIDACYGGLLTATRAIDKTPRRDLAYLREIAREPVRQVLTAGGKGEEVLDGGPNGHSVFTGRLIEVLESAGDFITANEIQAILRERVYGDARARNYTQTPAYGALSGSGDFVFVPSLEQKVSDNRNEIAQLEAELKAIDAAEAQAKTAASRAERERQQHEVESARKAAAGKLKAEQLKQQQLAAEQTQRTAEAVERQRLLAAKGEDEKKLAELKTAAEARRKNVATQTSGDFRTFDSAVAEIRRLNQQISQIEAGYQKDLTVTRQRIEQRHARQLAALDAESKDEFESQLAFEVRIGQQRSELQRQREEELSRLNVAQLSAAETDPLKTRIQALAEREYMLGADHILVELGSYDADKQVFPVALRPRPAGKGAAPTPLKLALNGTLPLSPADARQFKQHWTAGLVRAEVSATPAGDTKMVQLVNEADGSRRQPFGGAFMTGEEWERQEKQERASRPAMLAIPAGSFDMGYAGDSDERPIHRVTLPAFELAQTEVTQAQWQAVMGGNPSRFSGCESCPVENVSWDDVQVYLGKLNALTGKYYRLPSEAEWEYACRAGGRHTYCGSNQLGDVAWVGDNSGSKTHPVGQKQANAFGLHDLSGNVWEWVADCYHDSYSGAPSDGSVWQDGGCSRRVERGGSWLFSAGYAHAADRDRNVLSNRVSFLGFRPARTLP
ncbi:MAG: SUMF1/EgtB/PvdO family nonheme iron enzyme [Pseudomonadota bacterium]|nr:SUMF1/EgtB/PvdO family nonheme iron enzyme [Pseudomonadota bacterium]